MPIPDFQTLMLPFLTRLADREEHAMADLVDSLSDEYGLTPDERRELLPSGLGRVIVNRVGWVRTYLVKAGLVAGTRRGHVRITERGIAALAERPARIDIGYLERFPEFGEFRSSEQSRSRASPAGEGMLSKLLRAAGRRSARSDGVRR